MCQIVTQKFIFRYLGLSFQDSISVGVLSLNILKYQLKKGVFQIELGLRHLFYNTCVGENLVFAQWEININVLNCAGQG